VYPKNLQNSILSNVRDARSPGVDRTATRTEHDLNSTPTTAADGGRIYYNITNFLD